MLRLEEQKRPCCGGCAALRCWAIKQTRIAFIRSGKTNKKSLQAAKRRKFCNSNAGGAAEADKTQKAVDKVKDAIDKVRRLTDPDKVKKEGANAIKFMAEAVTSMSDLLASGGLVYGSLDDYENWK